MNNTTASHIDYLINNCGVFSSKLDQKNHINDLDFSNESILITGAAGTIGSGLTKQLIHCKFKKLILLDIAESPMYALIKDLEFHNTRNIEYIILNITDHKALEYLFESHRPTLVFHTAAYKHVPLMEQNPHEAIKTNVFGTKFLADLSIEHKVKKFIFVSTDKAVDPVSIMGITKAIGEKYLKFLNSKNKTFFAIARCGNIIGSNGSFLQVLKNQIESNGTITITDKEVSRFFITQQSACDLILRISTFEHTENDTFILKMGAPLKITDIVNRVLLHYGKPNIKVNFKYTGLRMGEKLHEKLISEDESLKPTKNNNILLIENKKKMELKAIKFSELEAITAFDLNSKVKTILENFHKTL
ncbi:polysaccharide biosynthesis protein [Algibacter mikhailovii]|uniref:polysaccharide biosynthesis protein n=1 Tax=Algibacter mikhailovii TaxID=425498 RepID=UPI002494C97A|nr:polysaccharide biosynthesis protein [Algibacter mikhailovii]